MLFGCAWKLRAEQSKSEQDIFIKAVFCITVMQKWERQRSYGHWRMLNWKNKNVLLKMTVWPTALRKGLLQLNLLDALLCGFLPLWEHLTLLPKSALYWPQKLKQFERKKENTHILWKVIHSSNYVLISANMSVFVLSKGITLFLDHWSC